MIDSPSRYAPYEERYKEERVNAYLTAPLELCTFWELCALSQLITWWVGLHAPANAASFQYHVFPAAFDRTQEFERTAGIEQSEIVTLRRMASGLFHLLGQRQ